MSEHIETWKQSGYHRIYFGQPLSVARDVNEEELTVREWEAKKFGDGGSTLRNKLVRSLASQRISAHFLVTPCFTPRNLAV